MKEFKPRVREKWRKEAVITIKTLLQVVQNPKGCFENKEELILVKINKGHFQTTASFSCSKKGTKTLLKFIKDELYLK